MILSFPNLDTLRLVLTSGLVPSEVSLSPAAFCTTAAGAIVVETSGKLTKKTANELTKFGVSGVKSLPGPTRSISCWLEIVPVAKLGGPIELASQTPVMFELPSPQDLPAIASEMLRLGNDRQSYRWLAKSSEAESQRVLLRVIGPPYYTLLRAIDRVETETGSTIRGYLEAAPRVWVELGQTHPFADKIQLPEGESLLIRATSEWVYLQEAPFQDIYEILEFDLPESPVQWQEVEIDQPISVPLKLMPGNATDAAEFWVLRGEGLRQLDEFVRDTDERTVQRLKFAVADSPDGGTVVVLRLTPSKQPPPSIAFPQAVGYRPYWKIPNLFIPAGMRLHPQLRREAIRNLLADDTDQAVWLQLGEAGQFTPHTLPEDAFRPLEDWIDYIVETAQIPLKNWVQSTTFDFQQFVCGDGKDPRNPPPGDKGVKDRKLGFRQDPLTPSTGPATGPKPADSTSPSSGGPTNLEPVPAVESKPVSEWKLRREELQQRFLDSTGTLDSPDRLALWPELARANQGAGDSAEAAICWLNWLWNHREPPTSAVQGWQELDGGLPLTTLEELDRSLTPSGAEPASHEVRRQAAAVYALALQAPPPAWFLERLPKVQRYFEANEGKLPIRAVWLISSRLARLNGADVLGLARVRDRVLNRLLESGLNPELDLPYFLRTAGLKDSSRVRAVKDQLTQLHQLIRTWADKGGKSSGVPTAADNRVTLPYIDLMFAFAFARLGEVIPARALLDAAQKAMVFEKPTDDRQITSTFLFQAFRYRVEQAIANQPHGGPLDPALLAELDLIHKRGPSTPQNNNPYSMAHYAIARLREESQILDPQENLDPYAEMTKLNDDLKKSLIDLHKQKDPAVLARTIRDLYKNGANGRATPESRFLVLLDALALSARVGESFSIELLSLVPETLRGVAAPGLAIADLLKKQGTMFERTLILAGHYDLREVAHQTVDEFIAQVKQKSEDQRFELVNIVAKECLRSLRKLGLRDEVDRLLGLLQDVVLNKQDLPTLRARFAGKPEMWSRALQTLLSLATGWLTYDLPQKAEPILQLARDEILAPTATKIQPRDFTPLAQAYIVAVAQQHAELALPALCKLFKEVDPARTTNSFTTSKFYSRFHLMLVEEVVLAVVSDDFALGAEGRRWLEEDEQLVRRRIHREMRGQLDASGL